MDNNLDDLGKSYKLAAQLRDMIPIIQEIDLEYTRTVANALVSKGNFNDSAAVLNPSYDPDASDLFRIQGNALLKFVEYIDLLKNIDELKLKVSANSRHRSDISKMFL